MNRWLKKCHARLDSTRERGSGFPWMVWIRTNVHGMTISCKLRNRDPTVDFDECVWETKSLISPFFQKYLTNVSKFIASKKIVAGNKPTKAVRLSLFSQNDIKHLVCLASSTRSTSTEPARTKWPGYTPGKKWTGNTCSFRLGGCV